MTSPLGAHRKKNRKTGGMISIIRCCAGSAEVGDYVAVRKAGAVPAQARIVDCGALPLGRVTGFVRDGSGNPVRYRNSVIFEHVSLSGPGPGRDRIQAATSASEMIVTPLPSKRQRKGSQSAALS